MEFETHDVVFVIRSESAVASGPSSGGEGALVAVAGEEYAHRGPDDPRWNG